MSKPRRLFNLAVKNVAAVGSPANKTSWLLVKAAAPTTPEALKAALARLMATDLPDALKEQAKKRMLAAAKEAGVDTAAMAKDYGGAMALPMGGGGATTFDDAMFRRRIGDVYETLGEQYGALMDVVGNICASDDVEDKVAAAKTALMDFVAAVQAAIPGMVADLEGDDSALTKVGRKISSARLAKLRTLHTTLGEILAEGETAMGEVQKSAPDATALTKISHAIAAMFGRAAGASDETIAALEKAAGEEPPTIPDNIQTLLTKAAADQEALRKSNDELKARLDKADADAKLQAEAVVKSTAEAAKLREESDLRKFADEVSGYKDIGLDPAKDAALLKAVEDKVGKESADRLREVFKAQLAQKHSRGLMREIGSNAAGAAPESAVAEVEQKIDAIMAKGENKLDRGAAAGQVYAENPGLYDRVRGETMVKV